MNYRIVLRRSAQKNLDSLSEQEYKIVLQSILSLRSNPRPFKVKKLSNLNNKSLWRIRVGKFRIVYVIEDKNKLIIILRVVRRRENTYKGII